jgi:hypothetical protein
MPLSVDDSFIEASAWPNDEERRGLARFFAGPSRRGGTAPPRSAIQEQKAMRRKRLTPQGKGVGARDRVRTGDIHVGNVVLYQLSYSCPTGASYGTAAGKASQPRGSAAK